MKPFFVSALAASLAAVPMSGIAGAAPTTRTLHVSASRADTTISRTVHAAGHRALGLVTGGQRSTAIEPVATADGDVTVTDDGVNTLTVSGQGDGFVPGLSYLSFIYGNPSTARGPAACLPPTPNTFTPLQMFVAYWLPVTANKRTLFAVKTGLSYTSLQSIGTISIRYDSTPTISPLIGQTPLRFYLQSCGPV